jgi:hypothetical protein
VLADAGFEVFVVDEEGRRLVPGVRPDEIAGYVNVVAARPGRAAELVERTA